MAASNSAAGLRLVVVPLDPIGTYERSGYGDFLEAYFNPGGMFDEVFAISPLETGRWRAFGMTIVGVAEREFAEAVRGVSPHVVRAYGGLWNSDLVCRQRVPGVPVVVSVHDRLPENVYPSVRYADRVLCTSEAVRRQVLARGTDARRTRILPNRIDRAVFRPIHEEHLLAPIAARFPAGKYILHVGRKDHQKNLDTLIRALATLPADYRVVFVGMGDRSAYVSLAESLGVSDRCFWIDAIPHSELPRWYSWCDCMCVPSRSEGFGTVFIEAAACGAAIVTSNREPMNEYLTDGVSGCLVKEHENPAAIAAAVRRVCEDARFHATIAAGAVAAAAPFDRASVDALEMSFYREAITLGSPGTGRRLEIAAWRARNTLGAARRSSLARLKQSLTHLRSAIPSFGNIAR